MSTKEKTTITVTDQTLDVVHRAHAEIFEAEARRMPLDATVRRAAEELAQASEK
jgi:hypothetical protein